VNWSPLIEGLLLIAAAAIVFAAWMHARARARRAHRALAQSEERFRNLTALSADWFWETDAESRITWLTGGPAVLEFFGAGLAFGRRLWELPGVELDGRAFTEHLEKLRLRLPFFDLELARRDASGARQSHLVSGQPRYDSRGVFLGYRGVGRDVTERRRSEGELAAAKERLELALEGSTASLWDTDLRSGKVYLSEGWAEFIGRPRAPTVTTIDELMQRVHPQDLPRAVKVSAEAMKGERADYVEEHRYRTESGDWKWLQSRGKVSERDERGRALRMTGINIDITARKRAEQAVREAEERYRALIELAPDAVVVYAGGVIEYANPAAARLMRVAAPRELLGRRVEDFVQADDLERFRERLRYLEAGPGTVGFEERRLRRPDGTELVVETASASYLERGRLVMQSVVRDVTEQRKAREALAEREQRFRDVVEASGEYVWETDAQWRYTYLSARVEAVLGYMRAELIGRRPREFMPLGEARVLDAFFDRNGREGQPFRDLMHRSLTKSGKVIWQQVSGVPVRDAAGHLVGYRGTGADITARKQAEERIQYLATRDALTGLPNRALLADRAGQAILAAARGRSQLALLLFDLDRFSLVNDSLGHQAGDALLRAVAERLQNTLRREDTLARVGGDEFVLLWDGLKSVQEAALVAQRIQDTLQRPFTIEGRPLSVSASIGVAIYPADGRDFSALLKSADTAMVHAKETGRGGLRLYSPELNARAVERLALDNELRGGLARGELLLHWQPVLRHGALVGAEALVRWNHPQRGLLGPDTFIPAAEQSGLIRAIGEWTLERALSQIGAWQRLLPGEPWFALNVSALELAQGEAYVARLRDALAAHGVPGSRLELEVTERVLMANVAEHSETLRRIGELGVRLAIDDFGTGYSSLAYLRRLPIDKLKIDRSFLRELDSSSGDAAIVETVAAMARSLGLHVAAEGVETEAQLKRLLAVGCHEWQGHFFSPPLDAPAFERLALESGSAAAGAMNPAA
jgi:diguanylate cyclase (GGDEF)-like protein/PAS domain S-box-containing protein